MENLKMIRNGKDCILTFNFYVFFLNKIACILYIVLTLLNKKCQWSKLEVDILLF